MDNLETKLVSAKDLIDYCKHYIELYKGTQTDKARRDELYAVIGQIVNMPSEQSDRKKGKWIPVDSFSAFGGDESMWMAHENPVAFYYCSNCKEQAYAGEDGQSLITDFCPSCGADMRGEQDEN